MSWENYTSVNIANVAQSLITNFSSFPSVAGTVSVTVSITEKHWTVPSDCTFSTGYLIGDSSCGFNCAIDSNTNYWAVTAMLEGVQKGGKQLFYRYNGVRNKNSIVMVINEELQLGGWCAITTDQSDEYFNAITMAISNDAYNILKGVTPVLYNWSSVPAISGKNGILLPMSTLNDINDGNEVTTSDTSKFNLNDSSNIKNLVDTVVNDF